MGLAAHGKGRGSRDSWRLIQGCFDGASEGVTGRIFVFEMDRVGACLLQGRAPLNGKGGYAGGGQGEGEDEGRAQVEGLARARGEALPSPGRGGRCGARQAVVVG